MKQLDEELWKPTALGTVGPTGFMSEAANRGSHYLFYLPLFDANLRRPRLSPAHRRALKVVDGLDDLARIAAPATPWPELRSMRPAIPDEAWFGVIMMPENGTVPLCMSLARPWKKDPRLGDFFYFASRVGAPGRNAELLTAMWVVLLHELARRGAVGVVTQIAHPGVMARAVELAGFKTAQEVLHDQGLLGVKT